MPNEHGRIFHPRPHRPGDLALKQRILCLLHPGSQTSVQTSVDPPIPPFLDPVPLLGGIDVQIK